MKKLSENIDDLYYGDEPDYTDELNAIEDGGFEEMYPEDYKNSEKADYIHRSAAERGMSDLDYVNQEEFFDEIIDSDPQDGPYIVDIEESDGYSEFICDDNGNPNLEDARPIYDDLVSGRKKGLYGLDCKDDPYEALSDVIEGYDMMVDDAMLGRHSLKGALKMLYKFKDNPNCPKTKVYFNALANYAEQINTIANDIGALDLIIDIPGKFEESTKRVNESMPTRAEYFSKEAGRSYAEETIETEDDILCDDDEIRSIATSQGADAEPFLRGYKDFVTDWLEVPTKDLLGESSKLQEEDSEEKYLTYKGHTCGWFKEDGFLFFNDDVKGSPNNWESYDRRALPGLKKRWKADIDQNLAKSECDGKDCKKKSKKDKLDEISEGGLAKVVVAYKVDDPKKESLKDSRGEPYAVAYDEDLSDKQNIDKLKRFLRQKGVPESTILKLKFKKASA